MRRALRLQIWLICLLTLPAQAAPPNILFIYVDDLGYGDLGSFGHPTIQTPHLDRLAQQGVRLTNYYAPSALCSPSRAAVLTGRHPYRTGIKSWIPANSSIYLHEEELTLAELLRARGYQTALIGKWHLNSDLGNPDEPQPADHGFEYAMGHNAFQIPTNRNPTNLYRNGQALGEVPGFTAQIYADEAIQWIGAVQQPFFLFLSMAEPHTTIENPPDYNARYQPFINGGIRPIPSGLPEPPKALLVPRGPGEYYANITYLDAQLGRVLETLEKLDLTDHTIVVFASDNGPVTSQWMYWHEVNAYGDTGGLRGRKHLLYEGGIKVPALVRAPAILPGGTVSDALVVGTDWFATLAAWTDTPLPASRQLDGADVTTALQGEHQAPRQILWALDSVSEFEFALREGSWKLLLDRQGNARELYDLSTDPLELFNLVGAEPARAAAMTRLYRDMYADIERDPLRPRS